MKLTLPRSELAVALARVKSLANSHGYIALTAAADTGLTVQAQAQAPGAPGQACRYTLANVRLEAPGAVTVRGALLSELVRLSEAPDAQLQADATGLTLTLGTAVHKLPQPVIAPEYPPITHSGPVHEFTLEDQALAALLAWTAPAVSADPVRGLLTCHGTSFTAAGQLEMYGCDGHRLIVAQQPARYTGELPPLVIPSLGARELLRWLGTDAKSATVVRVEYSDTAVIIHCGPVVYSVARPAGDYPDVRRLLIDATPVANAMPRKDLVRRLETLSLMADAVTLDFAEGRLTLTSIGPRGAERLGDASDTVALTIERPHTGTYHTSHLLALFRAAPLETVDLSVTTTGHLLRLQSGAAWHAVLASCTI